VYRVVLDVAAAVRARTLDTTAISYCAFRLEVDTHKGAYFNRC
jgi:hypothetical protein